VRIVPAEPVAIERVIELWPTLRQSLLGAYDECALSTYFALRYQNGWSTTPQARGTLLHRTFAECLRTMQRQGHRTISVGEALEILTEVCRQRDVPAEDLVRVPLREIRDMRMAVTKFAADNEFSIERIVDIERRLEAPLNYELDGETVERRFTGQLDVLLFDPPDGAVVIDWKSGFGLPAERREPGDDEELAGLSYLGYFQQRAYAWLVMANYSNVDRVTTREFYVYRTKVRKATITREQLPEIVAELSILAEHVDRALMSGAPDLRPGEDGTVDFAALGYWRPSPGKHCGFCLRPTACPIPEAVRASVGAAVRGPESASRWAQRLLIAERIRNESREVLKGYVETSGQPVPVKDAKGRRVLGWQSTPRGRRFTFFTPDDSDRGGSREIDRQIKAALQEATTRAREERGVTPR
jgi:hypothetical protein